MRQIIIIITALVLVGCENSSDLILQGKVERETLGVASKIPGRITEIKVAEGQSVQKETP